MNTLITNERNTETIIDQQLENLWWEDDPRSSERTVWKQGVKTKKHQIALEGKRPDYVLYQKRSKIHFTDIKLKTSGLWTSKHNKSASQSSILMSVRAPVGTVNITERDVAIGRGLCSINANEKKYNQKFLFYNLKANENKISKLSQGSTFDNINKNQLKTFIIPLPPIEIQKEIVSKIDKEIEAVDRCKWLIETYKQKIQDKINKLYDGIGK